MHIDDPCFHAPVQKGVVNDLQPLQQLLFSLLHNKAILQVILEVSSQMFEHWRVVISDKLDGGIVDLEKWVV